MTKKEPRRSARRVRIKTGSAKKRSQKLENYARKGNAEQVADILSEMGYAALTDLVKPKWWGLQDVDQLRTGRKLIEDLFQDVPTPYHDDMKAGVTALGISIVRALSKSAPRLKR